MPTHDKYTTTFAIITNTYWCKRVCIANPLIGYVVARHSGSYMIRTVKIDIRFAGEKNTSNADTHTLTYTATHMSEYVCGHIMSKAKTSIP